MRPRHTAEQSTVSVNKREKMGRVGFGAVAIKNVLNPVPEKKDYDYETMMAKITSDPQEKFLCDSCQ